MTKTNPSIEYEHQDIQKIIDNKTAIFENNINHEPVWKIIDQWIEDAQISEQQKLDVGNIKISPSLFVFFYELTNVLHAGNLTSQIRETVKLNDYVCVSLSISQKTWITFTRNLYLLLLNVST